MKAQRAQKGETYDRFVKTDPETKVAHIRHVTTTSDGKVHMDYFLDMSNLSDEEILDAAAKNINIRWMRPGKFRPASSDDVIAMHEQTFKAENFRPERKTADPKTKVLRLTGKMSKEERLALIKELQQNS